MTIEAANPLALHVSNQDPSWNIPAAVSQSVKSLIRDPRPDFTIDMVLQSNLAPDVKRSLAVFCMDRKVYTEFEVTYLDTLGYVWDRIHRSFDPDVLLDILADNVRASKDRNNFSTLARLLNVLSGFYEDIVV